jgi:hypothetical protein
MNNWQLNALLVLLFVLLGEYFAASEIASVSLRDAASLRGGAGGPRAQLDFGLPQPVRGGWATVLARRVRALPDLMSGDTLGERRIRHA